MSKFIDSLMTKSASEAVEALAAKYAEVQDAKKTNYINIGSVLESFSALPEESRRAIIGGVSGAGIGGLGALGLGYLKHKKLKLKDALYGALAGAIPGAAIGALSAPQLQQAPKEKTPPPEPPPLTGPPPKPKPSAIDLIAAPLTMFSPRGDGIPLFADDILDNKAGVTLGGIGGGILGARVGYKYPTDILDGISALKTPKLLPHLQAIQDSKNINNMFEGEKDLINAFKAPGNDRLFGGTSRFLPSRNLIKGVGGIGGGILGLITGANLGYSAEKGIQGLAQSGADALNKFNKEP